MLQHLAFINLMAIFIIFSVPSWLARYIFVRKYLLGVMRYCVRFLPATIIFNLLIILFHWPAFVDATLQSGLIHFLAHFAMVIGFIIVWMVILSFLTLGNKPLYKIYTQLPKLFGISALDDQRIAGLIMKIGQGLLIWGMIAVIWFSWSNEEKNRELRFSSEKENKL